MREKQTNIDFSEHELHITKQDGLIVHFLKKPGTYYDCIKYINTNGIMAVTGDYSNWIFNREFIPSPTAEHWDGYMKEKLVISSCQEPAKYDAKRTEEAIKEFLKEEDLSEENREFLEELLTKVDDELEFLYYAFREGNHSIDYEYMPYVKSVNYHFLAIMDGYNEICKRLRESEENKFYCVSSDSLVHGISCEKWCGDENCKTLCK